MFVFKLSHFLKVFAIIHKVKSNLIVYFPPYLVCLRYVNDNHHRNITFSQWNWNISEKEKKIYQSIFYLLKHLRTRLQNATVFEECFNFGNTYICIYQGGLVTDLKNTEMTRNFVNPEIMKISVKFVENRRK